MDVGGRGNKTSQGETRRDVQEDRAGDREERTERESIREGKRGKGRERATRISDRLTWSNFVRFSPNAFRALEPRTIKSPKMRLTCQNHTIIICIRYQLPRLSPCPLSLQNAGFKTTGTKSQIYAGRGEDLGLTAGFPSPTTSP